VTDQTRNNEAREPTGMSERERDEEALEESMLDGGERVTKGNTRDEE